MAYIQVSIPGGFGLLPDDSTPAYIEGFQAFFSMNRGLADNPHVPNSTQYYDWIDGYDFAMLEWEE